MDLATWEAGGSYVELLGHRTFVRREGEGPRLLVLHGFPTASWDWWKVWPALTANFEVVAFDFLGFGLSAKPAGHRLAIVDQADIAEALLGHLGWTQVHLLAHDYGDTVAQELLARNSERDSPKYLSVCFLNGGLFPETHRPRPIQRLLLSPLGPLVAKLSSKGALRKTFDRIFGPDTRPSADELDTFWTLLSRDDGRSAMPRLIRYMPQRIQHRERWVGALGTVPTCLINGSVDPVSGDHMVRRYAEVVGEASVVKLPRIGHYPQTEAPEEVAEAFLAFHRELGSV
jgi:pimeloyl-ACP methyl ester carboxylesterase